MIETLLQPPINGLEEIENQTEKMAENVEVLTTPTALHLGERALALEKIMAYYNQAARTAGSAAVAGNPASRFRQRYGEHASAVQKDAEQKTAALVKEFHAAIDVLANDADEDDGTIRVSIQHDLNKKYQYASPAVRRQVVQRAKRSAGLNE
jgi:hypothetical protein